MVDRPLQGYDQFINDYVGLVTVLPTPECTAPEEAALSHDVILILHVDDELVSEIRRDIAKARQQWSRWFRR